MKKILSVLKDRLYFSNSVANVDMQFKFTLDADLEGNNQIIFNSNFESLGGQIKFLHTFCEATNIKCEIANYIRVQKNDAKFSTVNWSTNTADSKLTNTLTFFGDIYREEDMQNILRNQLKITIEYKDDNGNKKYLPTQYFNLSPFAPTPTISDSDRDLGSKNKGWDLTYYVDSQDKSAKLLTEVKLNNTIIQTYQDTPKYTSLVCQITDTMIEKLPYNKENTITITCTDTENSKSATRIFTFTKANNPPQISGNDENLGVQESNMQQFFTVTDAEHDEVIVTIKVDNTVIDTYKADQSKKYSAYIPIDIWNRLANGGHKLYIIAKDSHENTSTRTYTFSKANAIPIISDSDRNLGNKNVGFFIDYTVSDSDNDKLTITEKLNDSVIRTLKDVASETKETLTISTEEIKKLAINQENKIEINVDDSKGGIAKRTYTFSRINTAPTISDNDRNLGIQQYNIQQKYTVSDAEQDTVTVKEFVDNIQLNYYTVTLNQERTLYIPKDVWIELPNGKHTLSIVATDSNNATSKRTYTFTKQENQIELSLKKAFSTDAKANKILITPSWYNISNATVLVEVCNNALDTNPSWEDCTKEVLANDKYTFRNTRKEGTKWGINIRFSITRKSGTEQIIFDGFGGSYE